MNDVCVKITVVKLCFEKKTEESVVETFKKCFAGICQQIFGKNISEDILGKIDDKLLSCLADFGY